MTANPDGHLTIMGTFTEAAEINTLVTVDFYGDPGDASGNGEGAVFLGSTSFDTDGSGFSTFSATITLPHR